VNLCGETTKDHYREEHRDALDQSALLEVLDALRNADAADRIKQAAETIYQALIDAELPRSSVRAPTSEPRPEPTSATERGRAR